MCGFCVAGNPGEDGRAEGIGKSGFANKGVEELLEAIRR